MDRGNGALVAERAEPMMDRRGPQDALLRTLFSAAVDSVHPVHVIPGELPIRLSPGRTLVVGAGKAAAAMAAALERASGRPLSGLVVTRYGHGCDTAGVEVIEAGHPVPDEAATVAAERILQIVNSAGEDDLVYCLVSGGGSSLLGLPLPGLSLADIQDTTRQLLVSGASIGEINCVRRHMLSTAGGRLAARAWPARVLTLAVSDVPGDDPSAIASGPTAADPTTITDAKAILNRYSIALAEAVRASLGESVKPGDPHLARAEFTIVARGTDALKAAAALARSKGYEVIDLGDRIEGSARMVAQEHAALARRLQASRRRACILSGGETSVAVLGDGRGGRNTEYLLALALALDGTAGIHALACDTDGIDGTEDNAGAVIAPSTLARARRLGHDPAVFLENNDSYGFFAAVDDLVVTGPTRTNVNDFRAILVDAE